MTVERAYVDRRITDVAAALRVAQVAADRWDLDRPELLRHGMNAIFRAGDTALRVATPSAPAEVSIKLARTLIGAGIPIVAPVRPDVVVVGGMSVTAWELVSSSGAPIDWRSVGTIVRSVHALSPDALPNGLPRPSPTAFPWWNFAQMLDDVGAFIDDDALDGIRTTLDRHRDWADFGRCVVSHGDVHPGNVLMSGSGPVLIDWDLLCIAPPGWDHAPMMAWTDRWGGDAGVYEAFADGYGWSARGDGQSEAFAELRLVAATLMRVKAAMANPAAKPEADRRLRYWRGDPDAPPWHAQ